MLGVVFKKYPKPKSVRKSIATIKLPKHEELCSTKQVLPVYLSQLVSGWQNILIILFVLEVAEKIWYQESEAGPSQNAVWTWMLSSWQTGAVCPKESFC